jgi:hypothetical protein
MGGSMRTLPFLSAMPVVLAACSLVSLEGCSSSHDQPQAAATSGQDGSHGYQFASAVSGSRLRAKYVTSADGARQFVGWYDSQRQEDCRFDVAEDGETRCMPIAAQLGSQLSVSGYADSACKNQLAVFNPSAQGSSSAVVDACAITAASTAIVNGGVNCGGAVIQNKMMSATRLDPNATTYVSGPTGCSPAPPGSNVASGTQVAYSIGAPIPASSFVKGTEQVGPGPGGDIVARYMIGDDGAKEHVGWSIPSLGVNCTFQRIGDDTIRCIPVTAMSTGTQVFDNPSCSGFPSSLEWYGGSCETPFWLMPDPFADRSVAGCSPVVRVFALGAPSPSPSSELGGYAEYGAGQCMASGYGGTRYPITRDLTTTLPVTDWVGSVAGRLLPALVSTAISRDLVPGWYDTAKQAECTFRLASDGKLRCLPVAPLATILFRASACAGDKIAGLAAAPCNGELPRFALETSTGQCPRTSKVYALGAAAETLSSASALTAPGRCVHLAGASNVFAATEVPATDFVEGTASTE